MLHASETFDVNQCHSCGLCALVCPVYQQGGGVMKTPHGLAKASQCRAELKREDVFACILCGACAPLCPQGIDIMQMLVAMRNTFNDKTSINALPAKVASQKNKIVFIADRSLTKDSERLTSILRLLGNDHVILSHDQAADISEAIRTGESVSFERMHQFLTSLQSVKKIIVSDGMLQKLISSKLPQIEMQSLGRALSSRSDVRKNLDANDFYVMDSQSYHANYAQAVIYYDQLQQQTDCQLSRDLHRLAIPSGAQSINGFDQATQVKWLLRGRKVKRVIAESQADYQLLSRYCEQPVVHVAELSQ